MSAWSESCLTSDLHIVSCQISMWVIEWALKILRISCPSIWGTVPPPFHPDHSSAVATMVGSWLSSFNFPCCLPSGGSASEQWNGQKVAERRQKPWCWIMTFWMVRPDRAGGSWADCRGGRAPLDGKCGCQSMGKHHGTHWSWQDCKSSSFSWINSSWHHLQWISTNLFFQSVWNSFFFGSPAARSESEPKGSSFSM